MKQRDKVLGAAFLGAFSVWAYIAYIAPEQRAAFFGFVGTTVPALAGLISHRLNPESQPPATPAPTPKETPP